jgi:hypothetical protein
MHIVQLADSLIYVMDKQYRYKFEPEGSIDTMVRV